MLINFNKETKTFNLSNTNMSLILHINDLGVLENIYFGKYIHEISNCSYDSIKRTYADCYNYYDLEKNKEVNCDENYFSMHSSKLECPTSSTYDKRGGLIKIIDNDNVSITDFRFSSYEIIKGKPKLEHLPYIRNKIDNECETLVITLKNLRNNVICKMFYTIFKCENVIVRHNEIINKNEYSIKLTRAFSFCLDLPSNDYEVISLHGAYYYDREIEKNPIKHNVLKISDNYGCKGFYHNPMCMLKKLGANEANGEVFGFGLVYSSNFTFDFIGDNVDQTRILGGINDEDFCFLLNENDNFITPEAVIIYSSEGTDKITNTFHDLIRNNLLRKEAREDKTTILLNSWEACYFDFNTDKFLNFIDNAKELGINLVVMDDGWFGKRNNDLCSLGDWNVNREKIDLKKIIDYAHSLGIQFGIWIEPEMISYDSNLYREHPEFALFDSKTNPTLLRHQFVLDMTNDKAINAVFSQLKEIFDEYEIDYCKWDFNRFITEAVSKTLQNPHQFEIYHRFILGTYKLLDKFVNRYPHILLETCAGGGGRFDMGMLFYSNQIWASDDSDPTTRIYIQHATSMFYPLSVIGTHVSARKMLSIKEKAAIAFFGTYGYELDPSKLNEKQKEEIKECNCKYLEYRNLIYKGDYFELCNPFYENFVSWEVLSKDKDEALVLFMNTKRCNNNSRFLKLKGLDKNKLYWNDLSKNTNYGDFYENIGLNLSFGFESFTPILIHLKEVNE